jgi:hypothetical protein
LRFLIHDPFRSGFRLRRYGDRAHAVSSTQSQRNRRALGALRSPRVS